MDKHKHKLRQLAFSAKCTLELFITKTLSQTPRPLYPWKTETVSSPKNIIILGGYYEKLFN
jgi:hypothetical protein